MDMKWEDCNFLEHREGKHVGFKYGFKDVKFYCCHLGCDLDRPCDKKKCIFIKIYNAI